MDSARGGRVGIAGISRVDSDYTDRGRATAVAWLSGSAEQYVLAVSESSTTTNGKDDDDDGGSDRALAVV